MFGCKSADSVSELWKQAQEAYTAGDYAQAEAGFLEILELNPKSVEAMYNLGNCHLAGNDLGKARLWYERALKYRPTDPDVRHNLAIVKARRNNPVVEIRHFFLLRWIRGVANQVSPLGWAVLMLLCFWTTLYLVARSVIQKSWKQRRVLLGFCAGACVLCLVFGAQRCADLHRNNAGVIIAASVMNVAPDQESKRVANPGPGEKVILLDSLQQFYKIRLANFEQGWMEKAAITKI
jgi:hypothetical protein